MADPTKVLGTEITLTTANNIGLASLVRVVNLDASNTVLITQKANTGSTIGTITLGIASSNYCNEFIAKEPTDTLEVTGTAVVKAVSVAYY
jgi:hypothetical protein